MASGKGFPKVSELCEMSLDELQAKLDQLSNELIHARFEHAMSRLTKTSNLKSLRRSIARIKTIMTEKQQRV
ncbi:MAG: 50S ribosomal protein L29 [Desulfovibrio sp.]|nr:50S ribosomal protein L29 [Desulfovibrio sp.]